MATFSSLPNGWEVRYGKSIFTENKRKNKSLENSTILSLSYGKIVVKKSPDEGLVPAEYSGYQILAPGDIVIRCTDLQNDQKSQRVGIVEVEGIITSAYLGLKVNDGVSSRYIAYWLKNWDATKEIYRYGSGLRQSLSWVDLKYLPIPLPPLPEQKAIVAYLDAETGKIDKAIAAEEKMIALLQERREIVINEAVGGGDLSHAEAQRGRVRRGWEVKKLKYLCHISSGEVRSKEMLTENEHAYPVYGGGECIGHTNAWNCDETKILVGRVGSCGTITFPKRKCWATDNALVLSAFGVNLVFFYYALCAANLKKLNVANAQPLITATKVKNVSIPLPPLPEQEAIVERLDRETGKIDRAIEVKRRQIELLRERRQIVIDEVVTGKVKVA